MEPGGWERLIHLFATRMGWREGDVLECPLATLLRLVRMLRRAETERALEARRVADWPWAGEAARRAWRNAAAEELAALSPPLPPAESRIAEPKVREHVRRVQERVRNGL